MTLEKIEESLPNGLHDAQIMDLSVSYDRMELSLRTRILVGLPAQSGPARDTYRNGTFLFRPLRFLAMELPEPSSAFQSAGSIWFSYERTSPENLPAQLVKALPPETHYYSLFIRDWFASVHIATGQVDFFWDAADAAPAAA
jgi:hypothetical protein